MSNDKELEELLGIMEKQEEHPSQIQMQIFAFRLANYEGSRFDYYLQRFREIEYK